MLALSLGIGGAAFHDVPACEQSPPRDPGGASAGARLSGVVAGARGPIAGATLTLLSSTFRRVTVESDEQGRFVFAALGEGLYTLRVAKAGYLETTFGETRSWDGGTPIALVPGQHITDLRLQLARGGAISGTVRGIDGQPATAIRVMVAPAGRPGVHDDVITDAHGAFQISGLREDDYVLMAQTKFAKSEVPTFFPGVIDPARAMRIHVKPDEERGAVDFSLLPARRVRVSGVVLGPDGQPYGGARLTIRPPAWDPYNAKLEVAPGADGKFVFTDVIPGSHAIEVMGRLPLDARLAAGEDIEVGDADISDVTLRLQPLTRVSGLARFEGKSIPASLDLTKVRVFIERDGFHPGEAKVGADGTFTYDLRPGSYRLNALPPEGHAGWRLHSAAANGRDLLDSPFEVTWGTSDITGIVLSFSDRHTQVSGTVMTSGDLPGPGSTVVVFPVTRALWNPSSRRLAAARPATNGRYTFRDLPSGEYYLATVRDLGGPEWRVPERLEPLVPGGVRISLGEGETIRQDFRIVVPAAR
jgi:hypothetical protein